MRRPTKDLVDAVTGEARGSRASSIKAESVDRDVPDFDKNSEPKIKEEVNENTANETWRALPYGSTDDGERDSNLPPSPLHDKVPIVIRKTPELEPASANLLPATVLTDRRRRASSVSGPDMAALAAGSTQRTLRAQQAAEINRSQSADISQLNRPTLKRDDKKGLIRREDVEDEKTEQRTARRHSSMAELRASRGQKEMLDSSSFSRRGVDRRATLLDNTDSSRHKETRVGLRKNSVDLGEDKEVREVDGGNGQDESCIIVSEKAGGIRRPERMASRRRSTML